MAQRLLDLAGPGLPGICFVPAHDVADKAPGNCLQAALLGEILNRCALVC